jgi:hypothetical protein
LAALQANLATADLGTGALVDPDQPDDRDREALGPSRGGYSTKRWLVTTAPAT